MTRVQHVVNVVMLWAAYDLISAIVAAILSG